MSKFATAAKSATAVNDGLFNNRQKLKTENLIAAYPEGVTVTEFRRFNGQDGPFWLVGFKEDPAVYFSATTVMTKILEDWTEKFGGGDPKTASDALTADGGCRLKFHQEKTSAGKTYVAVDVLD